MARLQRNVDVTAENMRLAGEATRKKQAELSEAKKQIEELKARLDVSATKLFIEDMLLVIVLVLPRLVRPCYLEKLAKCNI